MIDYIAATYALSIIGGISYFILARNRISPKHARYIIYQIVFLSLILPLLEAQKLSFFNYFIPMVNGQQNAEECTATTFRKINFLDFFITYKNTILYAFTVAAFVIFLLLILRIVYLLRLIHLANTHTIELDGNTYYLLYNESSITVGSFRLFRKYIVWPKRLDELSDQEKKAILYHEISHFQQHTTWEKICMTLLQVMWLMNPVIYLFKKELSKLQELIADQFAIFKIGNPKLYANLLIKLKENQQQFSTTQKSGYVAPFAKSQLKSRIQHIVAKNHYSKATAVLINIIIIATLMVATFTLVPATSKKVNSVKYYQTMFHINSETGQVHFCTKCTFNKKIEPENQLKN